MGRPVSLIRRHSPSALNSNISGYHPVYVRYTTWEEFRLNQGIQCAHLLSYSTAKNNETDKSQAYLGQDYPPYYPVSIPHVSLTPENTIHYQIYSEDAKREWSSIFPEGGGFLRLGSDGQLFGFALFHQMHCLARIRRAMSVQQSSEHVHHCFNYLRQSILCEANPTIEPVIPILGRRSVNAEIPRVCKDWTQVYELAVENYRELIRSGPRDELPRPTYD